MIAYFARHPTAANLMMLACLIAGALSMGRLRRATFPDFEPVRIQVSYPFPGATPAEVEETICERVENAIDSVQDVREIRSDARDGVAVFTVEMAERGEAAAFKDEIQTALDGITGFPESVEDPITIQLGTTELVLDLIVTGPESPRDLKAYAEDLKDRLQRLPEVASVTINGFSDHQLRVEVPAAALMQFNLSVEQLADILSRQNLDLPAGSIEADDREVVVRMVEQRRAIPELEQIVIHATAGGAQIRLGEIATITDTFEDEEDQVIIDGERAAQLRVEKTIDQDTIRVADAVRAFVIAEEDRMPDTVQFLITNDLSLLVTGRLNLLYNFAWQGSVLVFLVLWMFFSVRLSFWVVMSLPISIIGAFVLMPGFDLTINMISMMAFLLAIGILMDDGIVVAENVAAHAARGKEPLESAVGGVSEVGAGVLSSFFTTVLVLGPLIFVSGEIGRVIRAVPITLIIVLVVSLVEAFFILPAHLGKALKHRQQETRGLRKRFNAAIEWTRENLFGRLLDRLLHWRYLWVGSVLFVFLISISLAISGVLKFQGFPSPDGDMLLARIVLPSGTPFARTEETVRQVTDALNRVNAEFAPRQPDGRPLVDSVYVLLGEEGSNRGPHVATVVADFLNAEQRNGQLNDIIQAWIRETGPVPDVVSLEFSEPVVGPEGRAIEVRVQGDDLDELTEAAALTRDWMGQWEGVMNLNSDLRPGKEELQYRLRDGAFGLGLDSAQVARQLRAAFQGVTATEIQIGSEAYDVDVMLTRADQSGLDDLDHYFLTLPDGTQAPLDSVIEATHARGWSRIVRFNGRRTATVSGDVDSEVIKTNILFQEFETEFLPEFQSRFPDIQISLEGEVRKTAEAQESLIIAGLVGVLGVFMLLSIQFRSYFEPLLVMIAIPLSLVGVIWGHLLLNHDLTILAIFGFISLAGIVVNDSILLVLFLKQRTREGASILESAAQASRQRFRAIMLTSLTTIAGLLPLLLERSFQAQFLIPLAISVAFGLAASTVLVLLVVPCLYVIAADFGLIAAGQPPDDISRDASGGSSSAG